MSKKVEALPSKIQRNRQNYTERVVQKETKVIQTKRNEFVESDRWSGERSWEWGRRA